LYFIPNQGQVNKEALFYAKAPRYTLWLTKEGLVLDIIRRIDRQKTSPSQIQLKKANFPDDFIYKRNVVRLAFCNANQDPDVVQIGDAEYKVNYFSGKNESKWHTKIKATKAALYKDLYHCIDFKVYGIESQIEYDFVVKPGGDISDIGFKYLAVKKAGIDAQGNLIVKTAFGEITHTKPKGYQVIDGEKIFVEAGFKNIAGNTFGLFAETYHKNYDLIIDPVLVYSTYLGGSGEEFWSDITVDASGAAYIVGSTYSVDFPTKYPLQGSIAADRDVCITKFNASANEIVFSTYLGGSGEDEGLGIALDTDGSAYITGGTWSDNFPTKNPFQGRGGHIDAFVAKINSSGGDLVYSSYLGGSGPEHGCGIAVDSQKSVYVTGYTYSDDFPTKNAIQANRVRSSDLFITKLNASGKSLIYSTYLGGSSFDFGRSIAIDSECAVYVTGTSESSNFPTQSAFQKSFAGARDAVIVKISPTGSELIYSTYLGGSDDEESWSIAIDSKGRPYITGHTKSADFPTLNPVQKSLKGERDSYIAALNSSGTALTCSTYLGGSGDETGYGITLNSAGNVFITGQTNSNDFPTFNPIQKTLGSAQDAYVTALNFSGESFVYSTYLGGSGDDSGVKIASDSSGAVYVVGETQSPNFPLQNPVQKRFGGVKDNFVAKIADSLPGIRIVSWNILNYPNINGDSREEYFNKVLGALSPDILIVQEMTSSYGVDQFLQNVLKPISKKYKAVKFYDGPDSDNALFFDKSKFKVQRPKQILTSFHDISEFSIKVKKDPGKGSQFKIYSIHFTEGLTASHKIQRENEANMLRTHLNSLPPDSFYLVCGSFNLMTSAEKAYTILTEDQIDNIGRLKDPLNKPGKWHHKKKFRSLHSESTRKAKYGDSASGGLNDRYDMILISYSLDQNGSLTYKPGSCIVYGNDGEHYKKDINKPNNKIVSLDIADALYAASDHLPLIIELVPKEKSK
jgi:endonuclease/exonuclease/phosphatase family metal-dependent hydrolase